MTVKGSFPWEIAAAVGTSALITTALVTKLIYKKSVKKIVPKKWLKVGNVTELAIYPIKSAHGVSVQEGIVTNMGLKGVGSELLRDRVFMVVNDKGMFQVQKEFPKLAVIEFSAVNFVVTLKAPGMNDLTFELPEYSTQLERTCQIFLENNLKGLDCGDQVSEWLNNFLKSTGLRLVYHHLTSTQRHLSEMQQQFPLTSPQDLAAFQNYTSYLLICQKSIDDLNTHLKQSVTFQNFRPTILVSSQTEPFAEIKWGFVRIGKDIIFKASKPCERCSIVTVNQSTGIRDPTGDPLKTLTKLKPEFDDDEVRDLLKTRGIMGLQMGLPESTPRDLIIRIGDPVYVALL